MFRIEGYKSGKAVIVMALMEDILEAELLRQRLKKQFEDIRLKKD